MNDGHEIAGHGLKWIHYQDVTPAIEAQHLSEAMALIAKLTGESTTRAPENFTVPDGIQAVTVQIRVV